MMEDKKSDDEYMGNIWGWKISFLSLALLLVMLSIMGMRYCYLQQQEIVIEQMQKETNGDTIL
ncbi:MAG: hypothetical protein OEQ53_12040 [Saprospiraceae bacterium]|nr:hypothetical protein [Saprospiraceae bacterium]